jgi:hypothetical protein
MLASPVLERSAVMVFVLRSFVTGPLQLYAAELVRQGYTVSGAAQHLCFVAHLDRWMRAGRLGVGDPDLRARRPQAERTGPRQDQTTDKPAGPIPATR